MTLTNIGSTDTTTPTRRTTRRLRGRRVAAALIVFAMTYVAVFALARELSSDSNTSRVIALLLGLMIVPVIAAPIEWAVHRYVYHDRVISKLSAIYTVHLAHHFAYFPTWRYVTSGPARRLPVSNQHADVETSTWRNALIRLTHFTWYMSFGLVAFWAPAHLVTHNLWFVTGTVVGSAIVSNLFIVVHDTIHRPSSHRMVEAQPWFEFLDRHHYIHHVDLLCNLNFLLPLGDFMFGSLRTEMTPAELAEHGSLDRAKSHPSGEGERVRRNRVMELVHPST